EQEAAGLRVGEDVADVGIDVGPRGEGDVAERVMAVEARQGRRDGRQRLGEEDVALARRPETVGDAPGGVAEPFERRRIADLAHEAEYRSQPPERDARLVHAPGTPA